MTGPMPSVMAKARSPVRLGDLGEDSVDQAESNVPKHACSAFDSIPA